MSKPNTTKLGRLSAAFSVGLLLAAGITNASAAVRTWDGGGDPDVNWSNPLNWDGDTSAPVASDHLVFDGTAGLTNYNDIGGSWLSLTFAPGAGQFLLLGDTVMSMGTGGNAGITNSSANEQTIDIETKNNRTTYFDTTGANIVFTKRLWDWRYRKFGPNDLVIRQTLAGMNGQVEQLSGGRIILNGLVSGPLGQGLQINTGGTAVCAGPADQIGNNDSRADVTMSGGLFQVQNTNSLGDPDFEQIPMLRSSDLTSVVENGAAWGPVQLRVGGSGAGGFRVGAYDGTLQDGSGGGALSIMLNNFSGGVFWRLSGTNNYTGDTIITNGFGSGYTRMIVNGLNSGGGNYIVEGSASGSTAVLAGAGTVTAAAVNVNANGVLAPGGELNGTALYTRQGGGGSGSGASSANTGTFAESIAVLTINGAVTLADASSSLDVHLNGTTAGSGYDQIDITGSGSLANNSANLQLTIDLGFIPAAGDKFTLVQVQGTNPADNTGVFSTLNGVAADLSQGATNSIGANSFRISYTAEGGTFEGGGNDIMIEFLASTAADLTW